MVDAEPDAESPPPAATALPLGRDSLAWRVNADPVVFLGAGRALLMQVAHPAVGTAVEQHSTYARDPWGRLFGTVDVMMKLAFGPPEVSQRQSALLERLHRPVRGTTDDGAVYDASDPALRRWVWATLVDTAVLVHERVHGPLAPEERNRLYTESTLVAGGCGVPEGDWPADWPSFRSYVDATVRNGLRVTRSARAVAAATLLPPIPGLLGDRLGAPHRLVTIGLLPPNLRAEYGFEWTAADERQLRRWCNGLRVASRLTPAGVRTLPTVAIVRARRRPAAPWLRRRGAEITARRLDAAGFGTTPDRDTTTHVLGCGHE